MKYLFKALGFLLTVACFYLLFVPVVLLCIYVIVPLWHLRKPCHEDAVLLWVSTKLLFASPSIWYERQWEGEYEALQRERQELRSK